MQLDLQSGSGFLLLVGNRLQGDSQTADDPVEGAGQHGEQALAVGHGRQALDTGGIHHLTIAETTLDDEALGLVSVSELAQDASRSSRVLRGQSDGRVTP